MRYQDLKNKGTKICERDKYYSGNYVGMVEYWEHDNGIWFYDYNTNLLSFTGHNAIGMFGTIYDFDKYPHDFYIMDEETYDTIVNYCNEKKDNKVKY